MIPAFLVPMLAGRGLKIAGIGLAIVACSGFGFKKGLDWRADQVETAKAKTQQALTRAYDAEAKYDTLRRDVGAAMKAAQDRAVELEKGHAEAAKQAQEGIDRRIAGVLDAHKRVLILAERRREDRASAVPANCGTGILDDPTAVRELADRARAGDEAEARLAELQRIVKAHDDAVKSH